jgi:hypothetical protein
MSLPIIRSRDHCVQNADAELAGVFPGVSTWVETTDHRSAGALAEARKQQPFAVSQT